VTPLPHKKTMQGECSPALHTYPYRFVQKRSSKRIPTPSGCNSPAGSGLLVVVEDHLVGLAAETRLLVSTERGRRRIQLIAVYLHPASLDFAAHALGVDATA
jgi:hypothetical protein